MTSFDTPDWWQAGAAGNGQPLSKLTGTVLAGASTGIQTVQVTNVGLAVIRFEGDIAGQCVLEYGFYSDQAGTNLVSDAYLVNKSAQSIYTDIVRAPEGPWLGFQVHNTSTASITYDILVGALQFPAAFATVRPAETVIDEQNQALVGSGSNSYYPTRMRPGRYTCWAFVQENFTVRVERWNGGAWDIIFQQNIVISAPVEGTTFDFTAPADDWRVTVENATATTTVCWVAVTGPF